MDNNYWELSDEANAYLAAVEQASRAGEPLPEPSPQVKENLDALFAELPGSREA
jgi:hypothetical protein